MYRARLKKDLQRWQSLGLLAPEAAEAMMADYDGRSRFVTAGTLLLMLAAVLLSAALLLLVAANWDAIPRLAKIAGVLGLIWIFPLLAAWLRSAGRLAASDASLVLGVASFGAGLSLVGQLYHMSGSMMQLLSLWTAAAFAACLLFRSAAAAVLAALLGAWLVFAGYDENQWQWVAEARWLAPVMALLVTGLAGFVRRPALLHIACIIVVCWLVWIYSLTEQIAVAGWFAGLGLAAFVALSLLERRGLSASGIGAFHALLLAGFGLGVLNLEFAKGLPLAATALLTFGSGVLALMVKGRHDAVIRAVAYCLFGGEILYITLTTIDSLLGTSGFFFMSGLIVALLAFLVLRVERHFMAVRKQEGA